MSEVATVGVASGLQQGTWYFPQCQSRQDQRAERHLMNQRSPGIFIHLPEDLSWAPVRSTFGVSRVVSFGGSPCRAAGT